MSDEILDAEIVDLDPPTTGRGPDGRLLPGQQAVTRPKGAKGRVSQFLLESFAKYISEHPDENPVVTLINISMGRAFNKAGEAIEVPVSVRTTAAARLLSTFVPPSVTARFGDTINIDARGQEQLAILYKNDNYRRAAERMLIARSNALMFRGGDSHIIQPDSQAAIEAGQPQEAA